METRIHKLLYVMIVVNDKERNDLYNRLHGEMPASIYREYKYALETRREYLNEIFNYITS